jgi:peptidoglycan/LPS O-acetylase OafA/YrhL
VKGPERTSLERYAVLDGVRGLAVLLVLAAHFSEVCNCGTQPLFSGAGQFGVWLFFVLSAFLLSHYFFQKPERIRRPIEWGNYAFRRFMRIYPLYVAALVAFALAHDEVNRQLLPSFTLQAGTYWAIYVEFRYYFLLPAVVLLLWLIGRRCAIFPVLAIAAAVAANYWIFPAGATVPGYEPDRAGSILFPEYLIVFLIGTFAAWLYVNTPRARIFLSGCKSADVLLGVMIVGLFAAMPFLADRVLPSLRLAPDYYHLQWLPWGVFFAALIYLLMATKGQIAALFSSQLLRFFGYISYSLYLFMDYPIMLARRVHAWPLQMAVAVGGAILLAWALFVWVERPISRLSLIRRVP